MGKYGEWIGEKSPKGRMGKQVVVGVGGCFKGKETQNFLFFLER